MCHEGRHLLRHSPAVVWDALARLDRFESWWGWLSGFSVRGDGLAPGTMLEGWVTPPAPYRMHVYVAIESCVPEQEVDAMVSGDLAGPAHLRLEADGDATVAHTSWSLEMRQWPMRAAARVAFPVLRFAHDRVVDMTVAGFRRQLR